MEIADDKKYPLVDGIKTFEPAPTIFPNCDDRYTYDRLFIPLNEKFMKPAFSRLKDNYTLMSYFVFCLDQCKLNCCKHPLSSISMVTFSDSSATISLSAFSSCRIFCCLP